MRNSPGRNGKPSTPAKLHDAWTTLAQSGWLARRGETVRELLKSAARVREFAAGDTLYLAGDEPNGVFGLVEGAVEIAVPGTDGEESLLHRAEAGFWVGDLALFAGQRRLVTVRAASRCIVVHLGQEALSDSVMRHPELNRDFYELSHENIRTTLQLLGNLAIQSAESRIAMRLMMHANSLKQAGDWIRLSNDALAELVAVSPKTVRRTLHHLQGLGLIETGYARIRIIDYDALARECGHTLAP